MLKRALLCLMAYAISLNSFAAPLSKAGALDKIVVKYDYLLTSHPMAADKAFRKEKTAQFKAEISEAVSKMSKEEIKENLTNTLDKLPTKADRQTLEKVLANSTKEEMVSFVTDPSLLSKALQGQGANFFVNDGGSGDWFIYGLVAVIVTIMVLAIIHDFKYEYFSYYRYGSCNEYSEAEKEDIRVEAMSRCFSGAEFPDTCKLTSFGTRSYEECDENGEWCSSWNECEAETRAERKPKHQ